MGKTFILILICLLAYPATKIEAQALSRAKELSYHAYVNREIELWDKAVSIVENHYLENPDPEILYEYILIQFGYISYCIGANHKKEGKAMLALAYENLEKLEAGRKDDPELVAIRAAFLAFELNITPLKMMKVGPKAVELTNKAYEMSPDNLMCLSSKANMLNFTPSMFGGSTDEAIPMYHKILALYDKGTLQIRNDWRYINTMVILASSYEKKKNFKEACIIYEKIISADSTIRWVNNKLYPECLKKLN